MSERLAVRVGVSLVALFTLSTSLSLAADQLPEPQSGVWQQVARFGGPPIRGAQVFVIGGSAYVVCGVLDAGNTSRQVWTYDALANAWARLRDYPGTPASEGVAFAIGDVGYVCLGSTDAGVSANVTEVWQYDPASDAWTRGADFPGAPRTGSAVVVVDRTAYIFGGYSDRWLDEMWEYSPDADTWTLTATFPDGGRFTSAAFAIEGKAYFGPGAAEGDQEAATRGFWEYDPRTDSWARRADFPGQGRMSTASVAAGGRGYVVLGFPHPSQNPRPVREVWEYDATKDVWTRRGDFGGVARTMPTGFAIGADIYCGLGVSTAWRNLDDVWRLRPATTNP